MVASGDLRLRIDSTLSALRSGGMSNYLSILDQLSCLLFIKRLDENHPTDSSGARANPVFPAGLDGTGSDGLPYSELRWSAFAALEPDQAYAIVDRHVFPFLRGLGATYPPAEIMRDARLVIPTPALLHEAIQLVEGIAAEPDAFEYLLDRPPASAGSTQPVVPRHIAELVVALAAPTAADTIADPAVGTAGLLATAADYLRGAHPEDLAIDSARRRFESDTFTGFAADAALARIASVNLQLHSVENPDIGRLGDPEDVDTARYSLVLSILPFGGSLDRASALTSQVHTKKAELVSAALSLRLLADGGQAAVIVPGSLLIGASKAHKALRRMLVEDSRLDAVIRLPRGAFKPQSGASSAILLFSKAAGTDKVWFYDVRADGYSLDSRRVPLLPPEGLGAWGVPSQDSGGEPAADEHSRNDLPDVLARWAAVRTGRDDASGNEAAEQPRSAQCFFVPKAEIVAHDYDLSFDRYKQIEHGETANRAPEEILAELTALDAEIAHATRALAEVLKVDSSR